MPAALKLDGVNVTRMAKPARKGILINRYHAIDERATQFTRNQDKQAGQTTYIHYFCRNQFAKARPNGLHLVRLV